ncbi:acyclic terpene utilization AtuA family protein [Nocardioides sp. Soil796]|uniref:acyclic terpene utilization AtuA family protein n=1 Tax=Nocardioides sp. Soil796 TaxID=1736412 RepID=UPI000708E530|nr:acyclic terpene utilization AtuA family protein [Nocardioides sp. Soil796]KRF10519.1 ABC transporter substrate-binding protein [Nocardioides sp. Soil796]
MSASPNTVRIGSGAGFAGDRIGPAVDLLRDGGLDDLVLECLAERTIALGQQRRRLDPTSGYDERTRERFAALLPHALARGTRLISNLGAANPLGAGEVVLEVARGLGLACTVAVVTGDDVLAQLDLDQPCLEDGRPLHERGEIVSANAYIGAETLMPGLRAGADVVITGRVADPSLFVAALADRHGWDLDDTDVIAAGTLVGHLLECGTQVTGGYFADPGRKDVPGLADLGYPFADVAADGSVELGKLAGTGGVLDRRTVREQLLYEISDPGAYLTPDVSLGLYDVRIEETGADRVRVHGARGATRPEQLKTSVGYRAGHRAEAGISYAGPGCVDRARLAASVVRERLAASGTPIRVELTGSLSEGDGHHGEIEHARLRVAGMASSLDQAQHICHEVESLYTNGPAGGGGVRTSASEVIGIVSTMVDRDRVTPTTTILEA